MRRFEVGEGAAVALCVMAAACFGVLPLFARALTEFGMPPPAIAFYRFALSAAVFAPFVLTAPVRRIWPAVLGGAAIGLGWIGYVEALKSLTVAQVGVLFMTFPLFAILFGRILFRERAGARSLLAAGLILGAALLVAPLDGAPGSAPAVFAALAAPAAYGLLLNIIAHASGGLGGVRIAGAVALGSVLAVGPLLTAYPVAAVVPHTVEIALWLVAFGTVTALIPQLVLATFAPRIGAVPTAMAASVELPSTLLVGWAALGEALHPLDGVGAGLIVFAIWLGATVAKRR